MINWKLISKILGSLLFLEALFMALCLAMSAIYSEPDLLVFVISACITGAGASLFRYFGHDAENTLSRRDAYVVVTLTWVVFSVFGMLPFLIQGSPLSLTDAFFETMSGFTTTGATVIDDVESLSHGLLFWRSLMQWIGGLGIVFFTIAILPSMVGGSVKVFAAEATGPMRVKMHPRLSTTGRWIWGIYSTLTLVCAACFYLEGMGLFDCINYAMTVTATGGFATHNSSTGYFHNPAIDYTAIAFMFLCGSSFTLLYTTLFKRKFREFFRNSEFRLYLGMVVVCTVAIMGVLMVRCDYGISDAFRSSLFQVVSFLTTTGVFNDDAGQWPHITWVVLSVCMFVGGCAGSTSGGFKCIRAVMLWEIVRNEFRRLLHPNAVLPVRVGSTTVSYSHQLSLFAFLVMYISLSMVTYFIMIISDVDSTNAITIALSCASNVGPTLGLEIGPTMSWNVLPDLVKWLLSLLMLMGRLEILSVVVLFTPSFWRDK